VVSNLAPFLGSLPSRIKLKSGINCSAGGFSEKQQRVTELSDPSLLIAGKSFLTAYAQGVNNTEWNMTHIWKGAPYENKTVDDVGLLIHFFSSLN
jgi:polyhydroxybutyrate depolymerase